MFRAIEAVVSRFPPFMGNRLMAQGLRLAGVHLGRSTLFWGAPKLYGSGNFASRLAIGDHCGFNVGCVFELEAPISLGDHVSVGHDVTFLTKDPSNQVPAPIHVGSGAWIGARCTLMPGVTVGPGAVIAAGVVVKQDVAADIMITGNRKVSIAKWRTRPTPTANPA
ncbi:MAG: acyltransferase [Myxococcaceae bacterium]